MYVCVVKQPWCVSVLQRGQYGEMCVFASTLCKHDLRNVVFYWPEFDQSATNVSGNVSSGVFIYGGGV